MRTLAGWAWPSLAGCTRPSQFPGLVAGLHLEILHPSDLAMAALRVGTTGQSSGTAGSQSCSIMCTEAAFWQTSLVRRSVLASPPRLTRPSLSPVRPRRPCPITLTSAGQSRLELDGIIRRQPARPARLPASSL